MAIIEQVTMYKTADGKLFAEESRAIAHNHELQFMDWYCSHKLRVEDDNSGVATYEEIAIWMMGNRTKILEFLFAKPD